MWRVRGMYRERKGQVRDSNCTRFGPRLGTKVTDLKSVIETYKSRLRR